MRLVRNTLLALALLAASLSTQAAERKYAVMSLVGDRMMIVDHYPGPAAQGGGDIRSYLDLNTAALDNAVLFAIEAAVKKAQPTAVVMSLPVREPAILNAQQKSLDGDGALGAVLDALMPALAGSGATHLILVTKERRETSIELFRARATGGYLEGAGFYVDRTLPLVDVPSGVHYVGFLAPFAYYRITVVDVATLAVLKEAHVFVSHPVGKLEAVHPWDALSGGQKLSALQAILRQETAREIPALLPPE
jgi:hypothetical protein